MIKGILNSLLSAKVIYLIAVDMKQKKTDLLYLTKKLRRFGATKPFSTSSLYPNFLSFFVRYTGSAAQTFPSYTSTALESNET